MEKEVWNLMSCPSAAVVSGRQIKFVRVMVFQLYFTQTCATENMI
jgi:hypothetical protein